MTADARLVYSTESVLRITASLLYGNAVKVSEA
jgi:hypothetical protein